MLPNFNITRNTYPLKDLEYMIEVRELSNMDTYTVMMPLEVGDIILRDFELSLSFFTRTNKITPPPLNVQTCSTPIKIKIEVIMERLN